MSEPTDVYRAFEDMATRFQDAVASAAKQPGIPGPLLEPLRLQGELMRQASEMQQVFEAQLTGVARPLLALVEALERAPEVMRTQAAAFEAAAASLADSAKLLTLQADAVEQALSAVRAPAAALSRGALVSAEREADV
jgi:alpha-D-ribose 1-methylphosphonate 5-triphosphate synthase subunit PhnH